jgi:hypothetical protein
LEALPHESNELLWDPPWLSCQPPLLLLLVLVPLLYSSKLDLMLLLASCCQA